MEATTKADVQRVDAEPRSAVVIGAGILIQVASGYARDFEVLLGQRPAGP